MADGLPKIFRAKSHSNRKEGVAQHMKVSINGGTPIAGWFIVEDLKINSMILEHPHFRTPTYHFSMSLRSGSVQLCVCVFYFEKMQFEFEICTLAWCPCTSNSHKIIYSKVATHGFSWELQPDDHAVKVLIGERTPRILRWPF